LRHLRPAGTVHELNETVLEHNIRGIRGGAYDWNNSMPVDDRYNDFYVSDQFRDLGFRVANVASVGQPVSAPALPGLAHAALLLAIALLGTISEPIAAQQGVAADRLSSARS
ncbi:MAG TPA: hypothetical protein VNI20_01215, partial [Fimbriimonadaceae bacterium]|nr:hypothetical protein [Fimbriimonadaceae bacterium]